MGQQQQQPLQARWLPGSRARVAQDGISYRAQLRPTITARHSSPMNWHGAHSPTWPTCPESQASERPHHEAKKQMRSDGNQAGA